MPVVVTLFQGVSASKPASTTTFQPICNLASKRIRARPHPPLSVFALRHAERVRKEFYAVGGQPRHCGKDNQ